MRDISIIEKSIVKKLCSNEQQHLSDFIGEFLNESILSMNKESNSLDLIIKSSTNDGNTDFIVKEAHILTEKIVSIISFLIYLEKNGYILPIRLVHGISVDPKIFKSESVYKEYIKGGAKYSSYRFPDETIKNLIFKHMDNSFYPTQPLKDYFTNGFKTPEQKKHNQNIRLTIIGIVLSVILGLGGLWFNFIELSQPTEINKSQLMEITNRLDSLNRVLKNTNKIIIDTSSAQTFPHPRY